MTLRGLGTALFWSALGLIATSIVLIEKPFGTVKTCFYYSFASVLYVPLTWLAALLWAVSLALNPRWSRVGIFLVAVALYPLFTMWSCET